MADRLARLAMLSEDGLYLGSKSLLGRSCFPEAMEYVMADDRVPFALVADDDALIRMDAADILEAAGFRTHGAADVEEAIAILEYSAESIQLLFSDVQMPLGELNGFDLARMCAERWPHIGILVASGQIRPEDGELPKGATLSASRSARTSSIRGYRNCFPTT
jgi:CheY-like chemotaxis protein